MRSDPDPRRGRETGDRKAFLDRLAARQGPPPAGGPHTPPDPPQHVPVVRVRSLDGVAGTDTDRMVEVFTTAARAVDADVHLGDPQTAVAEIVRQHDVATAVLSAEPAARVLQPHLEALGVRVEPLGREQAAAADLGVTAAIAAVAATGSVVVDADLAGSRVTSLLPRVHLCVVDRRDVVAGTEAVLRDPARSLPAHRVMVTGPSRTGDIEQILTLGAHGPVALHVLLV